MNSMINKIDINSLTSPALVVTAIVFVLVATLCGPEPVSEKTIYLRQPPPGDVPVLFPLEVREGYFAAERIAISDDGRDIYYSEIKSYYPVRGASIKRYSFSKGKWRGPFTLFEGLSPALSVTGDTMFFERMPDDTNYVTFISVKDKKGWGVPKKFLAGLDNAHYTQTIQKGTYYTSSKAANGEGLTDWCVVTTSCADMVAKSLGKPLNTVGDNLDFYISRDESYMIVTNRPGLAISFRKDDGTWRDPVNFGPKIDFGLGSWGPWVTPDNKYLFYSTGTKPDYSDVGVYWVWIDGLIDSLKSKI